MSTPVRRAGGELFEYFSTLCCYLDVNVPSRTACVGAIRRDNAEWNVT